MKLHLAAEINKMPQKPERSPRAAYKRWRIAILTVGTILLHTIATVTVDATAIAMATTVATMLTTVAATPSLNPSTPGFLRRSIRVAHNGNAVIVCKTADRSRTVFHEVFENRISKPLNVTNKDLDPYAVLLLKGIQQNGTYQCKERGQLLSETILTIAASDLTSPEKIQIGSGDDAALVFVHNGETNINYSKQPLPRDYNDTRDEEIKTLDIDSHTKILLISNASAQKSVFTFTYGDGQRSNECELDVGKAPESVKSFLCIGENYDSMRCAITFPPNNLATEYKITYKISDNPISCKLDDSRDFKLGDITRNITLLKNNNESCIYFPNDEFYKFTVITSNVLGQFTNEYSINNHEHVVPAKLQVNLSDITSNSVRLTWFNMLKYYYIYGLVYDIAVQPVDFAKYSITADSSCLEYNCVVTNLNYAYWNYSLYIRARVNLPKSEWNKPTQLDFQTAKRRPDRAPHTYPGGFHINQDKIKLYWEGLAAYERNGPSFTYVIQEFDMHGQELILRETEETTIAFRWLDAPRIYKVYAKNAVGVSPNGSIIQVLPPRDLNPPQEIEKLFENGVFKLKWQHPRDFRKQTPSNYTVFWCPSTMTECEGNMHFEVVNKTEFELPSKSQHIMAVAANYPNGSSGLHWTTCFANLNSSLDIATLKVNAKSESRISLGWFHQNCRNAFDGYNITYCVWNNVTESDCLSATENVSRSKGFILTNLKTYTFYNIRVQLYGKNNRTSPPSTVLVCQTNEAAPEPPTNLYYEEKDITSHTAKISWDAPTVTNGILRKYYVWYKKHNEAIANYTEVSSAKQSVTIDKLSSGAVYEVWLTAWTSKQSNKSLSVNITTMIGIPTQPENVTLERDGGEYVLSWDAVEYAVDHMEFYELIFNDNHIRRILTVQRVSGSAKRHECRLKYTDCTEGVQNMQVRAVNVVAKKDLDRSAFAIEDERMQRQRRNADPAYNGSMVDTQTTTKGDITKNNGLQKKRFADDDNKTVKTLAYKYDFYNEFECKQIDAGIRTQLPYMAAASYYMLKSEPVSSKTNFNCSTFPWKILTASCIFVSMFVATVLWSYKVVRRQLKFHVQLPESVLQLMSVNTKLPNCLEDTKPENISIVSTKASDGTSLIYIGDTFAPTSSSESGVASVGDGDTDTPSTSSEEGDREIIPCWPTSEPTSPQTTITLNMFSQSTSQQSPLRSSPGLNKPILMDDDVVEQTKPIISNDSGTSSEFSYLPLHALKASKSVSPPQNTKLPIFGQATNNNNSNVNNKNIFNNLPLINGYVMNDSLHKLSAAHPSVDPLEMKYSQAQPKFIPATDSDDYVLQYTPHMMPTAHNTSMRADNNQSENALQQLFSQAQTVQLVADDTGYVPHDPLPLNAASHTFMLENELSRKPLTQPFVHPNSTHAQPNIFKNMALTKSGYVLPDSLARVGAPHNATSTADNDDTKRPLQQQVQPRVSYGYVTRN